MRRALAVLLVLLALPQRAAAWPAETMTALSRDARKLLPLSLGRLLGERETFVLDETRRFPPELSRALALDLPSYHDGSHRRGAGRAATVEPNMSDKRLKVAVVMDPIVEIKPAKDTTLAMMLAAQRRGWQLSCLGLGELWLRDGVALGRARPVEVRDDPTDWFTLGEPATTRLGDFDSS